MTLPTGGQPTKNSAFLKVSASGDCADPWELLWRYAANQKCVLSSMYHMALLQASASGRSGIDSWQKYPSLNFARLLCIIHGWDPAELNGRPLRGRTQEGGLKEEEK